MTSPQPDMGRVVERAAQNISALAVAPLGAQLAMAQEIADLRGAEITELKEAAGERDSENARLRETGQLLQERIQQLEAQLTEQTQGGAGASPEEGSGER